MDFFITGIDTGIGKTIFSIIFLRLFQKKELSTVYFKPLQTGEDKDTDRVKYFLGKDFPCIAPVFDYSDPLSPNIAAELANDFIHLPKLLTEIRKSKSINTYRVIEGVGGVEVPLNDSERLSDLLVQLDLPVIVVSNNFLGSLNKTILTVNSLQQKNIEVLAVVIMGEEDNKFIDTLKKHLPNVLMLTLPWMESISIHLIDELADILLKQTDFLDNFFEKETHNPSSKSIIETAFWLPFTQHAYNPLLRKVVSGKGAYFTLEDGSSVIDSVSSWWVNLHGHSHAKIASAIYQQALCLDHTLFANFQHESAEKLSIKLLEILQPSKLSKLFFSDNGSTSIEVALKMAYQFHVNRGKPRHKFLALNHGYHGDTIGAMSVSDPNGFHQLFSDLLFEVEFIEPNDFSALDKLKVNGDEYVALILEPLLQGAGGMLVYDQSFLEALTTRCQNYGIIVIFDEVFTGFYRTGNTCFVFQSTSVEPDILCISKGITGGTLPLGVTVASDEMFDTFLSDKVDFAFLHGHSYTANPIICAAACQSIDLLLEDKTLDRVKSIMNRTEYHVNRLKQITYNARQMGTIAAFDLIETSNYFVDNFSQKFFEIALSYGVFLRPLGTTVYVVPPYCCTDEEIDHIYNSIYSIISLELRGMLK